MPNLETTYLGLKLRNPIIVGSTGLTKSASKIKACEGNVLLPRARQRLGERHPR